MPINITYVLDCCMDKQEMFFFFRKVALPAKNVSVIISV